MSRCAFLAATGPNEVVARVEWWQELIRDVALLIVGGLLANVSGGRAARAQREMQDSAYQHLRRDQLADERRRERLATIVETRDWVDYAERLMRAWLTTPSDEDLGVQVEQHRASLRIIGDEALFREFWQYWAPAIQRPRNVGLTDEEDRYMDDLTNRIHVQMTLQYERLIAGEDIDVVPVEVLAELHSARTGTVEPFRPSATNLDSVGAPPE